MITATTGVYTNKRGFYPVDFEGYKKIKLLHKHYWIALSSAGAFTRYYAKKSHNRLIRRRNKIRLSQPLPMTVPFMPTIYEKIIKKDIVGLYNQARMPKENADLVKPLSISMSQVDGFLEEIEKAYAKK